MLRDKLKENVALITGRKFETRITSHPRKKRAKCSMYSWHLNREKWLFAKVLDGQGRYVCIPRSLRNYSTCNLSCLPFVGEGPFRDWMGG